MSDSENDDTHINFNSIFNGIKKVLNSKKQLDGMFKEFTNDVNSLNSSIILYKDQLKSSSNINNSHQSGKKMFCSNVNNNHLNDECNNNNNTEPKKKRKTSCYQESTKEGKAEYHKGENELDKAHRLLIFQQDHYNKLLKKHENTLNLVANEMSLSTDNNNNIRDINNNIIFAPNKSSNTPTPVLTKPTSSSPHRNWSSTDTTREIEINIPKSVVTILKNKTDKKNKNQISKQKEPRPSTTSPNFDEKNKRKRSTDLTNEYYEEVIEDSSEEQYSTTNVDSNNVTKTNVANTTIAELNQQSPTTTDVGAFNSDSNVSSNNNN
jgi:hypothetical protein